MVTLKKINDKFNQVILTLLGTSEDTKPSGSYQNKKLINGSEFIELDTNRVFYYDEKQEKFILPIGLYNDKTKEELEEEIIATAKMIQDGCKNIVSSYAEIINSNAFKSNTLLQTIKATKCTEVGTSAFYGCTNLVTADFDNCISFKASCFYKCTNLKTFKIKKNASLASAFASSGLTNLIVYANDVKITSSLCFSGTPISKGLGNIYVPDDRVEHYKTAPNWSAFAGQILPLSEAPI